MVLSTQKNHRPKNMQEDKMKTCFIYALYAQSKMGRSSDNHAAKGSQ